MKTASKMKIYHIGHSGFLLEWEDILLLFDYYCGELPKVDVEKPLYVWISHAHYDHYHPQIKELTKHFKQRYFIADEGIKDPAFQAVRYHTCYKTKHFRFYTLRSTDEGVAFLIERQGKTIYFAGDLHLWLWEEDSKEEQEAMKKRYLDELRLLQDHVIDVAFLVFDPRQEKAVAIQALELFDQMITVKHIIPMHYSFDENKMKKWLKDVKISSVLHYDDGGIYEI